ncbi:hypothetical protein EDD18DRAFT_1105019 [Armillaria luteobubalina]|uniref:Uncharacterized protein n=1 Tax=Armillaria luteobubalina TaxID=153913 RepID=A0AA39Q5J5_9AGAR|nr:hypothetical protein EDD18DRAFT_1105019 [Armillaria luteobubalina]
MTLQFFCQILQYGWLPPLQTAYRHPFGGYPVSSVLSATGAIVVAALFTELIASYTAGIHPYFEFQAMVLLLPQDKGMRFYGSMLDIIWRFESKYLFTHQRICLHMNADWQYWVGAGSGLRDAEMYAFAVEFALCYILHKWDFTSWVVSITCSLRHYSVELYYGHVAAQLGLAFTADDIAGWLLQKGIDISSPCGPLESYRLSIKRLSLHFPDGSETIKSTTGDERGTPPFLLQLFPVRIFRSESLYHLWEDKAFPVCLTTSAVQDLELIMSAHMYHILLKIAISSGSSITTLHLMFPSSVDTSPCGLRSVMSYRAPSIDAWECLMLHFLQLQPRIVTRRRLGPTGMIPSVV